MEGKGNGKERLFEAEILTVRKAFKELTLKRKELYNCIIGIQSEFSEPINKKAVDYVECSVGAIIIAIATLIITFVLSAVILIVVSLASELEFTTVDSWLYNHLGLDFSQLIGFITVLSFLLALIYFTLSSEKSNSYDYERYVLDFNSHVEAIKILLNELKNIDSLLDTLIHFQKMLYREFFNKATTDTITEEEYSYIARKFSSDEPLINLINNLNYLSEIKLDCCDQQFQKALGLSKNLLNILKNYDVNSASQVIANSDKTRLNNAIYNEAVVLNSVGDYIGAAGKLKLIPEYKDSKELLHDCANLYKKQRKRKQRTRITSLIILSALIFIIPVFDIGNKVEIVDKYYVGQTLNFGNLTWTVIDIDTKSGYATVLCDSTVNDEMPYNNIKKSVTWESSDLRKWLNDEFLKTFSEAEIDLIVEDIVTNNPNPDYGTDAGNDTEDKVFLLSIDEARKLPVEQRTTDYWYWLRSPGLDSDTAASVSANDGFVATASRGVNNKLGVRPVIRLKSAD